MTQTEALKLLVEALSLYETRTDGLVNKALAVGKEALAKPDQYAKGYADAMNWKAANHLEHLPVAEPDYKAMWQQMCERCEELGKKLAQQDDWIMAQSMALVKALSTEDSAQPHPNVDADNISSEHVYKTDENVHEPVAITITGKLGNIYSFTGDYSLKKGDKVYLTPPQRKPLTDEQKLMCWSRATHDADVEHKTEHQCLMDYGTEIEAAHGIKE